VYITQFTYKTEAQYLTVNSETVTNVDGWTIKSLFKCVTKPNSALNRAMVANAAEKQLTASGRDAVWDIIPALARMDYHKRRH
jgi:hypothetical protein